MSLQSLVALLLKDERAIVGVYLVRLGKLLVRLGKFLGIKIRLNHFLHFEELGCLGGLGCQARSFV